MSSKSFIRSFYVLSVLLKRANVEAYKLVVDYHAKLCSAITHTHTHTHTATHTLMPKHNFPFKSACKPLRNMQFQTKHKYRKLGKAELTTCVFPWSIWICIWLRYVLILLIPFCSDYPLLYLPYSSIYFHRKTMFCDCAAFWTFSLLFVQQHGNSYLLICTPNEDSNQPAHQHSLINHLLPAWRNFASLAI